MFNSPISEIQLGELFSATKSKPASALDIGCGDGTFLQWLNDMYGTTGTGVDKDENEIAIAQGNAGNKPLKFYATPFQTSEFSNEQHDLIVCIGSTHIFDEDDKAFPRAIEEMKSLVQKNGLLLVGDCYWRKEPDAEYLKIFGDTLPAFGSHQNNIEIIKKSGLHILASSECSRDQWDVFEFRHQEKMKMKFSKIPDENERNKLLQFLNKWKDHYDRWGRDTLGFGLYLISLNE